MKKVLVVLFLGLLLMVFASYDSYAKERRPMNDMGRCFQEEGFPMKQQMRHCGMGLKSEHPMWKHLMALGLDEKQKEEVKKIRNRVMKMVIKKRADMDIAKIELKELLDKNPVDMKAVEAKLKQIEAVKTEIHLSFIRAMEEIKSKLTTEQRKKFKEMNEMGPIMGPPMMHHRHGHEFH